MSQIVPKVDYSKSLIYKIVCNDTNIKNIYIGSTTNFKNRKNHHKCMCNDERPTKKLYKFICENGGWENWSMILIDYKPCDTKLELLKIEREYIEKQDCNLLLNHILPSRTKEEWTETNKEHIKELQHKKYLKNKDQHLKNCKDYYKENEESIKEYKHNWYLQNKEKWKEKINCPICNISIRKTDLARHKRTKRCLSYSA